MARALNNLEMLSKVLQIKNALDCNNMKDLALALDLTPEITDNMSLQEITDCLAVRLWDFTQEMENRL